MVPLTWSAVAFTVAKFVVAEKVFAPDIVCVVASVAYVEPMSVPLTWSVVAFTVAKFVVAENVFAPDIVWAPDSLTESPTPYTSQFEPFGDHAVVRGGRRGQ